MVPKGQVAYLNKALAEQSRSATRSYDLDSQSHQPWFASFKIVEEFPDWSQRLEVSSTWDDDRDNVGWYTAHEKRMVPERYRSVFGPGQAFGALPPALLSNALIWGIGFALVPRPKETAARVTASMSL